jgi:hypothetical protein
MLRLLAIPLAVLSFHSVVQPLSAPVRAELLTAKYWHMGCPVALSDLRVLTVTHWGFDGRVHTGQLVANKDAAPKLEHVFRRLYELRFPIREMRLHVVYGPNSPADSSGSFDCRQAVPSPCTGGTGTLVGARLRRGRRHQSGREPLRRLRHESRPRRPQVPEPVSPAPRDGHARSRRRIQRDRLGLGRRLGRIDQGLHALLRHRPLATRPGSGRGRVRPCLEGAARTGSRSV